MSKRQADIFEKSTIPHIREKLRTHCGNTTGESMYEQAKEQLLFLINNTDDRGSAAICSHLNQNLLPVIACYQVLQRNGIEKEKAYALVVDTMHSRAKKIGKWLHGFSRMPFFYSLFRVLCKNLMSNSFPDIGWKVSWLQNDKDGIAFDCRACV